MRDAGLACLTGCGRSNNRKYTAVTTTSLDPCILIAAPFFLIHPTDTHYKIPVFEILSHPVT